MSCGSCDRGKIPGARGKVVEGDAAYRVPGYKKLMGDEGDGLALKLELTATTEEFLTEARKTRDTLRSFLGARKAKEFWKLLGF